MFNGIVEIIGTIKNIEKANECLAITITHAESWSDISLGDSIAVNGVCLTVVDFTPNSFQVTVVPETLRLSNLGFLTSGSSVNLERSLKFSSRISGHLLQGHVEGMVEIIAIELEGDAWLVRMSAHESFLRYLVPKGYIALDGMSLTIISVDENFFTVTLIPHTRQVTIAQLYSAGSKINIETDVFARYIEKYTEEMLHAFLSKKSG